MDFLRELVLELFGKYGTLPLRKRIISGTTDLARYDTFNHWMVSTDSDTKGKAKRRNCKQCSEQGRKDNKTLLMCEKCLVPLHHHCFKERNFMPLVLFF